MTGPRASADRPDRIVACIRRHGSAGALSSAIAASTGIPVAAVGDVLLRLLAAGVIERHGVGRLFHWKLAKQERVA
jgi:predicted Rossmann fold nucleotide-binding protein DprA/Smf involved in DNA uptake